jgi:predicted  nucleic acid-binding Zn-ribbon protein
MHILPSRAPTSPGQGTSGSGNQALGTDYDEYEALRREHENLESRRQTLRELKEVEERQQALLERMQKLKYGGPSTG